MDEELEFLGTAGLSQPMLTDPNWLASLLCDTPVSSSECWSTVPNCRLSDNEKAEEPTPVYEDFLNDDFLNDDFLNVDFVNVDFLTEPTSPTYEDISTFLGSCQHTAAADKAKRNDRRDSSIVTVAGPYALPSMSDSGTYTCTYHGCTLWFETPAKLQKHKREVHQQTIRGQMAGHDHYTELAIANLQAGPHKCKQINPLTGKPCNSIFSWPYDLTRYEDTIYNPRKHKVRCRLYTEKTFIRNDALT
jgi:hypothetical protein